MASVSSSLTSSSSSDWASLAQVGQEPPVFHNCAYPFTNELLGFTARQVVSALTRFHGGFYFGVSGWENYSYILSSKPAVALLVDISEETMKIHQLAQECLLQASSRQKFEALVNEQLLTDRFKISNIFGGFKEEFEDPTSWLGSDTSYAQIREYFAEGRIVYFRRKIGSNNFFEQLNNWLDARGIMRRVFYFSNALDWVQFLEKYDKEKWIEKEKTEFVRRYIAPVLNESSLVIDTCLNPEVFARTLNALVYRGRSFAIGDLSTPILEPVPDLDDEKETASKPAIDESEEEGDVFDVIPIRPSLVAPTTEPNCLEKPDLD